MTTLRDAGDNIHNIVFADWKLPDMSGIELAEKIRNFCKDTEVVLILPLANRADIEEEANLAGVRYFLSKPLFPSALLDTIYPCIGLGNEKLYVHKHSASDLVRFDFSGNKIMIAEDIEINREIISMILEQTHISIKFAENGKIAVSEFERNPDQYDLIFMDIQMPEMNGFEATKAIRALGIKRAKEIPIIAMTANVFREDIEECLKAGMNDHIGKPIDQNKLFEKIKEYI
jgi:CheY-like chemotaxis protein